MRNIVFFKSFLLTTVLLLFCRNIYAQCDYSDDFDTFPTVTGTAWAGQNVEANTIKTTTAGWVCEKSLVVQGGGASGNNTNRTKYKPLELGEKGIDLWGDLNNIGRITSPVFNNGCSSLSFNYASQRSGQRQLEISIKQHDAIVWRDTLDVVPPANSTKYTYTKEGINITGNFQLLIINLCPSKDNDNNIGDDVVIWNICLTANPASSAQCDHSLDIVSLPASISTYLTTPVIIDGWTFNCLRHTGTNDYIVLNGGTENQQGSLSSPVFNDGCSKVKFSYYSTGTGGTKIKLEIKKNENVLLNKDITLLVDGQYHEVIVEDLNIAGNFQIVITNTTNSPNTQLPISIIRVKDICLTANSAAPTDQTPPTTPADLVSTPSFSSIHLTWTASTDNVGVEGYNIYLDGDLIDTVTDTKYTIQALIPETQYTVEVEAFDAAGNKSARASASVSTRTASFYASRVIEFLPAPGQFTNESIGQSASAEKILGNSNSMISLGGFGGYVILGFDQAIVNHPKNPYGVDFSIKGNSFAANLYGVWTEPGAVQVMKDLNGNGIPDDGEWYELAGSDYYMSGTKKNVEMTYYNPHYDVRYTVPWRTNYDETGALLSNQFHSHPYYPDPFDFGCDKDSLTYTGNVIKSTLDMSTPSYIEFYRAPAFGYCDSRGNSADLTNPQNPYFKDAKGAAADGFDISWAVDRNGNRVELDQINFVRIYTAGNANAGWLGEWSTEVLGVGITKPDPNYVPEDYYLNYIGITQLKVLKGKTCQFDGFLFKNGIPQTEGTQVWSTSNPTVGTVDDKGLFTAVGNGETWLRFSQKSDIPTDSIRLLVVELKSVILEMEGNSALTSDSTSLIVGETICITAQGEDNISDVLNGSKSNRFAYESFVWTTSNPAVGIIDNGLFKGLQVGRTMVYARSTSNPALSDSILVVVNEIPKVKAVENPIRIPYYSATGTKKSSELFTTGTNSTTYLNSVVSKNGRITPLIEKNSLKYSITEGNYGKDTLTFNITSYGITSEMNVAIVYGPDSYGMSEQLLLVDNSADANTKQFLKSFLPASAQTKTLLEQAGGTIRDLTVDGAFAFIAAKGYIARYNITTYESTHKQEQSDESFDKLAVYKNLLLAAAHNASENKVFVYNKTDLTPIKHFALFGSVTDMALVGGKLYVLTTSGQASKMAIIDLATLVLEKEKSLYAEGTGISNLVVSGANIYGMRRHTDIEPATVFRFDTNGETYSTKALGGIEPYFGNLPSIIAPATGDSILLVNGNGFTAYNTAAAELKNGNLMSKSGLYPTGSVYDPAERKYYVTYSNAQGKSAAGQVFDAQFAAAETIVGLEDSPNTLRFSPALTANEAPKVSTTNLSVSTLYEKATSTTNITINKTLFTDRENNFAIYVRDISRYAGWLSINPNYTTNGGIQLQAKFTEALDKDSIATFTVEAIDHYGLSAMRTFTITVKPRVYTPTAVNPIADLEVEMNSADVQIPLTDVFAHTATSGVTFGKKISDNTHTELVAASIADDVLTLSFTPNKAGEAIITLSDSARHATYGVKYAETSFKVTVKDDVPPAAPTGLTATPAETSIALAWTASTDNVSVGGYNIYLDGDSIDTVTATAYTVIGLNGGTDYTVAVEAFDASGNKSARTSRTVKTLSVPVVNDKPFVLNTHSLTLNIAQTAQLSITEPAEYNVSWRSLDDNIALVSSSGKVIGVSEGTTKVIASDAAKNKADTCIVTVLPATIHYSIKLNHTVLVMNAGDRISIEATVTPTSNNRVEWKSSNPSAATVTVGGTVIAIAPGNTEVTSTLPDGTTASCNVTVRDVEAVVDTLDVTDKTATLSFPKFAGTTYYLIHLYEMVGSQSQPILALKVNPEGKIINIVNLRASSNEIRLTLSDLKAATRYEADIDVVRSINGTDETVSTLTASFTTKNILTGIESLDANAKVWYADGALHLQNLNGYKGLISDIQGRTIAVFNVISSDESYRLSLVKGIYILSVKKEGRKNALKFTVY